MLYPYCFCSIRFWGCFGALLMLVLNQHKTIRLISTKCWFEQAGANINVRLRYDYVNLLYSCLFEPTLVLVILLVGRLKKAFSKMLLDWKLIWQLIELKFILLFWKPWRQVLRFTVAFKTFCLQISQSINPSKFN